MKHVLKKLWASKKPGWRLLRLVLLFVVLFFGFLMLMENHLIYFPAKDGDWDPRPFAVSGDLATTVEELEFQAADGTRLHGWLCRPNRQPRPGTFEPVDTDWLVLCCHGNAGNLSGRRTKISVLNQLPAYVFMFDYRGYGKSAGSPNEKGLYQDVRAAWDLMVARGFRPERIIVHGTSLGGGPAVDLAVNVRPAALVTESTFTSVPDMAAAVYPFVPRFLVRTKFDNLRKIPAVTCPKLIIHGTADRVVPYPMAEQLFAAANEPKTLYRVEGGSHDDTYLAGSEYLEHIRALMKTP